MVEVVKLRNVCWLDVKGEFDMRKLTVGGEYEIFFDIELSHGAQGWSCPVTFEHNSPFGLMSKFEMKLDHLIGQGRAEISIEKFSLPYIPIGTALSGCTSTVRTGRMGLSCVVSSSSRLSTATN